MTAISAMTHRVDILRDQSVGDDSWGDRQQPIWNVVTYDVPCRAWFGAEREQVGGRTAVVEDRHVIVPLDTEVSEQDRLGDITDRLGQLLYSGPMLIESVGRRLDHLDLSVSEVSS